MGVGFLVVGFSKGPHLAVHEDHLMLKVSAQSDGFQNGIQPAFQPAIRPPFEPAFQPYQPGIRYTAPVAAR